MKIAVLISGEYRTFDMAVKTMSFLNQESVDVYFSTWNRSVQKNVYLDIDINEEVSIERIRSALQKKPLTGCAIDDYNTIPKSRYNSAMIYRWHRGLNLIKESNINYDAIVIMRPDLYFRDQYFDFNWMRNLPDLTLYSAWYIDDREFLNDVISVANFETMFKSIMSINIHEWSIDKNSDWHLWFKQHMKNNNINVRRLGSHPNIQFYRPTCLETDSYDIVLEKSKEFTMATHYKNIIAWGCSKKRIEEIWSKDEIRGIEEWAQNKGVFFPPAIDDETVH